MDRLDKHTVRTRLNAEQRKAIEVEVTKFRETIAPGPHRTAAVREFRAKMQRAMLEAVGA